VEKSQRRLTTPPVPTPNRQINSGSRVVARESTRPGYSNKNAPDPLVALITASNKRLCGSDRSRRREKYGRRDEKKTMGEKTTSGVMLDRALGLCPSELRFGNRRIGREGGVDGVDAALNRDLESQSDSEKYYYYYY